MPRKKKEDCKATNKQSSKKKYTKHKIDKNGKHPTGFSVHKENINRKGRPPKDNSIAEIFRKKLEEKDPKKRKARIECIFDRAYQGALSFDNDASQWAKLIFDRAYGKARESLDVNVQEYEIIPAGKGE